MPSGGSVSFVYGFIFCIICNLCLSASVGELASLWPTAGGQYHYAYAMATKKWRNSMVSIVESSLDSLIQGQMDMRIG
jgi:amino acid transporter